MMRVYEQMVRQIPESTEEMRGCDKMGEERFQAEGAFLLSILKPHIVALRSAHLSMPSRELQGLERTMHEVTVTTDSLTLTHWLTSH